MNRIALAVFVAMVVVMGTLAVAGAGANAKKPAPAAFSGTISLNQTAPKLGDWVNFTYNVPGTVSDPRIQVQCFQNGAIVYGEAWAATTSFLLGSGSSQWLTNGGGADCTATLYQWDMRPVQNMVVFATTSFYAAGK